jgi:hypothetical protein
MVEPDDPIGLVREPLSQSPRRTSGSTIETEKTKPRAPLKRSARGDQHPQLVTSGANKKSPASQADSQQLKGTGTRPAWRATAKSGRLTILSGA